MLTGPTRQMSLQYSRIDRSDENLPLFAELMIDMRVQRWRSWYRLETWFCAAMYEGKSAISM